MDLGRRIWSQNTPKWGIKSAHKKKFNFQKFIKIDRNRFSTTSAGLSFEADLGIFSRAFQIFPEIFWNSSASFL